MDDSENWTPPENPDAHEILHEASRDSRGGRYALALAKFIWFHGNALRHCPSLSGVRLSFALAYWYELGQKYPPAMQALRQTRDAAESRFLQRGFGFSSFQELAALNRVLNKPERTVEAFKVADRDNREAATSVYHVAQPYLVMFQEYALCGKYIDPEGQLANAIELLNLQRKHELELADSAIRPPEVSRLFFVRDVTTLVALLVKNNRASEAASVRNRALDELDDDDFKSALQSALGGNVPYPYE
jgi:hypothetical protein